MKYITAAALMCLCACSTGEKQTDGTDSTAASNETSLAATPSTTPSAQYTPAEPDPIVDGAGTNDDIVALLRESCPPIEKGFLRVATDDRGTSLDSAVYYQMREQGAIQGWLRSITLIDNFLDGDNPTNPRKLTAAVFLAEELSTQESSYGDPKNISTISPTLAVFERSEEYLTLITWCVLGSWTGEMRSVDSSPPDPLTVQQVELITGQYGVALQYESDGFVDIDHTLAYNTFDWYAISQKQILKIFSYTTYFKEHVSAGDGENSSDYEYSIDISMKKLNSEKLRLVELKTTQEIGAPIDMYEASESTENTKPDGVYSYNGIYYARVRVVGSGN